MLTCMISNVHFVVSTNFEKWQNIMRSKVRILVLDHWIGEPWSWPQKPTIEDLEKLNAEYIEYYSI